MSSQLPDLRTVPFRNLFLLAAAHFAGAVFLTRNAWFWEQDALMAAVAIPLSQLELLAICAATQRVTPVLRFAIPSAGVFISWFVLSRILPWGLGDGATAAWAIALVIQVIIVFVAVGSFKLLSGWRVESESKNTGGVKARAFKFSIISLMLWTTLVALGFGFVQFGRYYWLWSTTFIKWQNLPAMPLLGVTSGLLGLVWLRAVVAEGLGTRLRRLLIAALIATGLAIFQSYSTNWICGITVMTLRDSLIVVTVQSVVVAVSVLAAKLGRSKLIEMHPALKSN